MRASVSHIKCDFLVFMAVSLGSEDMFQYKGIRNVFPTRATLSRDNFTGDSTCNLCNAEEQTLSHSLIS